MGEERILCLSVKKKWFDMIASGKKKEEYREHKLYWIKRLSLVKVERNNQGECVGVYDIPEYTHVLFTNGYNPKHGRRVKKKLVSIFLGYPKKGLCPDDMLGKQCYVIKFE